MSKLLLRHLIKKKKTRITSPTVHLVCCSFRLQDRQFQDPTPSCANFEEIQQNNGYKTLLQAGKSMICPCATPDAISTDIIMVATGGRRESGNGTIPNDSAYHEH